MTIDHDLFLISDMTSQELHRTILRLLLHIRIALTLTYLPRYIQVLVEIPLVILPVVKTLLSLLRHSNDRCLADPCHVTPCCQAAVT